MKKVYFAFALILLIIGFYKFYNFDGKQYVVVLKDGGFDPYKQEIKKGDSVRFETSLVSEFWPASDPHPAHYGYLGFDPKKAIKANDSWTFEFSKAGTFNYHDHLHPNLRGVIIVRDANAITRTISTISKYYKTKFEKHDESFLRKIEAKCTNPEWSNHQLFDRCWEQFLGEITKDFGPEEAMRIVHEGLKLGIFSNSDCHNRADIVGIDSYWQLVSGRKITFTKDFYVCQEGFFHGFMMEHVSHGQSMEESIKLCDSLDNSDGVAIDQCYVGIGGGLSFLYWGQYGNFVEKIINPALVECKKLPSHTDLCVYGAYGGLEHLFTGFHGSDMRIDTVKPFSICFNEKNILYRNYCLERLRLPVFSELEFDTSKVEILISNLPSYAQTMVSSELGRLFVLHQLYKSTNDVVNGVLKCRALSSLSYENCLKGGFDEIFINSNQFNGKYKDFNCDDKLFNFKERAVCNTEKYLVSQNLI